VYHPTTLVIKVLHVYYSHGEIPEAPTYMDEVVGLNQELLESILEEE
jgi:hypothetical protein